MIIQTKPAELYEENRQQASNKLHFAGLPALSLDYILCHCSYG